MMSRDLGPGSEPRLGRRELLELGGGWAAKAVRPSM
jgi:hypothetical protein